MKSHVMKSYFLALRWHQGGLLPAVGYRARACVEGLVPRAVARALHRGGSGLVAVAVAPLDEVDEEDGGDEDDSGSCEGRKGMPNFFVARGETRRGETRLRVPLAVRGGGAVTAHFDTVTTRAAFQARLAAARLPPDADVVLVYLLDPRWGRSRAIEGFMGPAQGAFSRARSM